jgi:hypothetical protein
LFFQANETNATTHDRKVVVEKRGFVKRFWSNATFSFLLDKFEERIWEFNMKLMKKQNWENFAIVVNIHFPSDVQHTWGHCRDKFNKMKDNYNVEKKKTNVTGAPPLDWLWDERFDYLFVGTIKIIELPQGVD